MTGIRTTVDQLYVDACARITRLEPAEAYREASSGALVVDLRSSEERRRRGVVPGSLHVPRTVLEWRLDPESRWRNPHVGGLDSRIILICDHGYSSALAAAGLLELGFARATDVIGGFEAWRDAGLPVTPPREPLEDELPGLGPPD